jgi:hypothetical protein
MSVFYPTDADGKATVSAFSTIPDNNIITFIDVLLQNQQSNITPSPPHLQGKTIILAYETPSGDQIIPYDDIDRFWTEDVFYFGQLNESDYQDPLW